MKSQLLKVTPGPNCSFSVRQAMLPYIHNRWHYHHEMELIYFRKGKGTQFIGDNVKAFKSGDLLLVGPKIPHCWRFDPDFIEESPGTKADVLVAHFYENFWGDDFLELPENADIRMLLENAKRGIQVFGKTRDYIAALMEEMSNADGTHKIVLLLKALHSIASSDESELLSSIGFKPIHKDVENDRINEIYHYSLANFRKKIQMKEIAAVINMSPTSFCRYFRAKTGKTYSDFLLEIRVGIACKLLLENRMSIKEICFESGFHNFGTFHKYFKMITHQTPLQYQQENLKQQSAPKPPH